ncbi:MAG TPA: terminase gpA endonuclease subunit, partial [Chthoniobacterales bacterium]|nr:terminase gpA endonuclease subunit [Chthoniobacterales bacterium]
TAGLFDSGFEPEDVYDFCLKQSGGCFDPYKGGDLSKTGGAKVRVTQVLDGQLDLHWAWSDFFAANLYYDCIKWGREFGEIVHFWLPVDVDEDYKKQLTDEYQGEENGKRKWISRTKNNHLGDCEKMQRVMRDPVEELLDAIRDKRAEEEARARGDLDE